MGPANFEDDFRAALAVFQRMARAILSGATPLRKARPASPALIAAATASLDVGADAARAFFTERFSARELGGAGPAASGDGRGQAFFTGYYEPVVEGSLKQSSEFTAPLLARPSDLVSFAPGEGPPRFDPRLAGARRRADGSLTPYPTRSEIEIAGGTPVVWVRDGVEAFLIHVQGSAKVVLPDRSVIRLVYDGRNGRPYTSIGRLLIDAGEIPGAEMSLARLKSWLRAHGLNEGDRGREWMRRNESYIFFRREDGSGTGPTGGAGLPLTPLRSIAVDRSIWSYGQPFWIEADLPDGPFRRLMIAEDTGTAIVGAGRFDLYIGSGEAAGVTAGSIRHDGRAFVLEPNP